MSSKGVPLDIGRAAAHFANTWSRAQGVDTRQLTGSFGSISFLQDLLGGAVVQVFDGGVLTRLRRTSGGLGCESSREQRRARGSGKALSGPEEHTASTATGAESEWRAVSSLDLDLGATTASRPIGSLQ